MSTALPIAAVTGGTGFLGRYVVRELAAAGWRPRLLVRGDPVHPQLADVDFEIVPGDLSEPQSLRRLVKGASAVVHVAGAVKALRRADFFAVNADGTARLAETTAEAAPGARLVYVSSLAARAPELSDYAASKAEGERALAEYGPGDWVTVRPAAVYGPWDREILRLFRAATGAFLAVPAAPKARICMVHAADVAAAVAALARAGPARRHFEVTDARVDGYDWSTIAAEARHAVGGNARVLSVPPAAVRAMGAAVGAVAQLRRRPSILTPGKARELMHDDWSSAPEQQPPPGVWRPCVGLRTGFEETARWYARNGDLPPLPDGPELRKGRSRYQCGKSQIDAGHGKAGMVMTPEKSSWRSKTTGSYNEQKFYDF
ncbi:MAG TPA: NAD-dependent epimerase/dehydratase family protein [Alphaproteobacteria bacterium]|nr:NAD-dependent epimerase/dehydratase family protein [Alphaproteobacteria bacterium]